MKNFLQSLYGKISIIYLVLLLILAAILIRVSIDSSLRFFEESDQRLNQSLARNLAVEFQPFLADSLDYAGIAEAFKHLMVMNPRVELYLLDEAGKILAFFAEPEKVKREYVSMESIRTFLGGETDLPIMGDDPRDSNRKKIFSVTPITIGSSSSGFLYIILGGELFDSAAEVIRNSFIAKTTAVSFGITFLFTGFIGLVLFAFVTKRFHNMTEVVKKFERGNLEERVDVKSRDEIGRLGNAFNQMADTIVTSMEELRQTDILRRELIANVSHDLRSPVASIQGYLETILMKDFSLTPEERQKFLKISLDNTTSLGILISELFELSKLDASQIQPKAERFSMAELAQDVIMKFKPLAENLEINLQSSLSHDLPPVYADIAMIERALSNLLENALCYTPMGGMVKLDLHRQNGSIRVEISDTGCGIPEKDIPYIFERFYRVEKSRARKTGGSGLGLAIAKKILEVHGSTIYIQSEVNTGSTFYFDIKI